MKIISTVVVLLALIPSLASAETSQNAARQPPSAEVPPLPSVHPPDVTQPNSVEALPLGGTVLNTESPLTLADLEGMALSNNPSLAELTARIEAARGDWVQAGLPPNPTAGYVAAEIGDEGRAGQQGGFVGQEFVTGGKLRFRQAVAMQDVQLAEQHLGAQRFRVLSDVRVCYYGVAIAQRKSELAAQLLDVSKRSIETAETLIQQHLAADVDLLQSRIEAGSARILADNASNEQVGAWRKLAAVVGMPDLKPVNLPADIETEMEAVTFDDALKQLSTESPEINLARMRLERARRDLHRAVAERVPNLEVMASVQHDNATQDEIAGVQVGIPIPLWNRNQGGIRRAQGELAAAQSGVDRVELGIRTRLATEYQKYINAQQQVRTYREDILPDARQSFDLMSQGYNHGKVTYLALLTSQRTYVQAHLAHLESLRNLQESKALIENMLLSGSLSTEMSP